MSVSWMRSGRPASTSARVTVRLTAASTSVRAIFSLSSDFTNPIYSSYVATSTARNYARMEVGGLQPGLRYYWRVEIDGVIDSANVARMRTQPTSGPLRITFGSCWAAVGQDQAQSTANHPVGSAVAAQDANIHLFIGDHGYPNNTSQSLEPYFDSYDALHGMSEFEIMSRALTWAVAMDDHDTGPNNADATNQAVAWAVAAHKAVEPGFTYPDPNAFYHSWVSGDGLIRFVMTDLRSYRSKDTNVDDASKTMLGSTQKAWLKQEWLSAKNSGQLIVWINTQMWCIDGPYLTSGINAEGDHWGAFSVERAELDEYRSVNEIVSMIQLTGDGHEIAYRLGVDYSTAQNVPCPVYAAAAYSSSVAFRSAAWDAVSSSSEPSGHYGLLTITKGHAGWLVDAEFHTVGPSTGTDLVLFSAPTQRIHDLAAGTYAVRAGSGLMTIPGQLVNLS